MNKYHFVWSYMLHLSCQLYFLFTNSWFSVTVLAVECNHMMLNLTRKTLGAWPGYRPENAKIMSTHDVILREYLWWDGEVGPTAATTDEISTIRCLAWHGGRWAELPPPQTDPILNQNCLISVKAEIVSTLRSERRARAGGGRFIKWN